MDSRAAYNRLKLFGGNPLCESGGMLVSVNAIIHVTWMIADLGIRYVRKAPDLGDSLGKTLAMRICGVTAGSALFALITVFASKTICSAGVTLLPEDFRHVWSV